MIKTDNVIKKYGSGDSEVTALNGISLQINDGEFAAVMGESGSGKSTLLSILGAMNTPTSGGVEINGIDIYKLSKDERSLFRGRELGFVFQSFYLVPYLTLLENVMVPLVITKKTKKEKLEMAEHSLGMVGLGSKSHRLPGEISGGEMERTAIARAIVNRPSLLLADEPTGNLDSKTGKTIMSLFSEFNKTGITIVMVTHSSEWAGYAGRVIRVADGVISD
jgi:putative ABC transport system ATP-binding protein